jgi:hypothetical protein
MSSVTVTSLQLFPIVANANETDFLISNFSLFCLLYFSTYTVQSLEIFILLKVNRSQNKIVKPKRTNEFVFLS